MKWVHFALKNLGIDFEIPFWIKPLFQPEEIPQEHVFFKTLFMFIFAFPRFILKIFWAILGYLGLLILFTSK